MSATLDALGQCLCGAIEIEARGMQSRVGACHCGMCRNWGGGPFLSMQCEGDITIKNGSKLSVFNSSEWAERGFCSNCGTHLFYKLKHSQQYFLPAGLFNLDEELEFDHQVFIDKKPLFYHFANATKNLSEAEVFALYNNE